jgi:YfiR/HmsC-like
MANSLGVRFLIAMPVGLSRLFLFVFWLLLSSQPALADPSKEGVVKSAVVFKLLLFVGWPSPAQSTDVLRLCVLEEGAFLNQMQLYSGRKINGQTLNVALRQGGTESMHGCHAVFVETGNVSALNRAIAFARQQPMLVLGEGNQALAQGAMITIDTEGGKIALDIHLESLRKSQLSASSKLLNLARRVIE